MCKLGNNLVPYIQVKTEKKHEHKAIKSCYLPVNPNRSLRFKTIINKPYIHKISISIKIKKF